MNVAIILAGGIGTRIESAKLPKQFIKIDNKEILIHTLEKFNNNENIKKILLVMNHNWINHTKDLLKKFNINKIMDIIEGGKNRPHSSFNALSYLNTKINKDDVVLIHDAVRPFISDAIINESIIKTKKYGASCVVVKTIDTILESENNFVENIICRKKLFNEQTPQSFLYSIIWDAYNKINIDNCSYTDDISFVRAIDKPVYLIKGDYINIKITTELDLILAESIYKYTYCK